MENNYDIQILKEPGIHSEVKVIPKNTNIYYDVFNYLSFFSENHRWSPAYKEGHWDGKIHFYQNGKLPVGLVYKVIELAERNNYSVKMNFKLEQDLNVEKLKDFIDSLNLPFEPHDFQYKSVLECITKKNLLVISPTASGKSLIIYILAQFFQRINKKLLIIVPRVGLVTQLYKDFESYNMKKIMTSVKKIHGGIDKSFDFPIVISTWQSLYKLKQKELDVFDAVIVDEAHNADAKSIKTMLMKMKKAEYRLGTTGTLPLANSAEFYTNIAYIGNYKQFVTTKELQERKILSNIKINALILNYPETIRKYASETLVKDYQSEIEFIMQYEDRSRFIMGLIEKCETKNTLVLFQRIEAHGKKLLDMVKQRFPNKKILYVDGGVKIDDREDVRTIMENNNDVILLASYGTFSEGVNIKNIHHIILASSYKSEIKILQSIGRGLRLHAEKENLVLWDIVDNLSIRREHTTYKNYLMNHYRDRLEIYQNEGFEVNKADIII